MQNYVKINNKTELNAILGDFTPEEANRILNSYVDEDYPLAYKLFGNGIRLLSELNKTNDEKDALYVKLQKEHSKTKMDLELCQMRLDSLIRDSL